MEYKGSDAHKASVTGDTVGDPFKDTSGPSMNILIKLMSIVSLVIAPHIALEQEPPLPEAPVEINMEAVPVTPETAKASPEAARTVAFEISA
jgi:K(+)-stimulated pyrophosphate-energized sodium pump